MVKYDGPRAKKHSKDLFRLWEMWEAETKVKSLKIVFALSPTYVQ